MAAMVERQRIKHLLRRAGFGGSREEIDQAVADGFEATVARLVNFDQVEDPVDGVLATMAGDVLDLTNLEDVQVEWLYRLLRTKRPLQEKMTLFWHGHFVSGHDKVQNAWIMREQNQLFRRHALGNFRALSLAVAKDPAMLVYLDGNTNRKASPNENYARELLELFALGIGHYTERDVQEMARAFTGWNTQASRRGPVFFFNRNQHDDGAKTILAQTKNFNGDEAIDVALAQPVHAAFIVNKLWSYFAYPQPAAEVIAPFIDLYRTSGFEIKPIVEAMFRADAFYSDRAMRGYVKSPVDYAVGAARALGMKARERTVIQNLGLMGQTLYSPPNVAGWPGNRAWINPSTLVERFNFAARLTTAAGLPYDNGEWEADTFLQRYGLTTWDQTIDFLLDLLIDVEPPPALREALSGYVAGADLKPRTIEIKLRGLAHLLLVSAEHQMA